MVKYGLGTKALHHMALDSVVIRKVGFDVDCIISRMRKITVASSSPVFIAGLARAGTTILLEAIYSTKKFTTLTYRDMPFVTSPILWGMLTACHRRTAEKMERAHGDGLYVNFDSPEAFEEIFWMTFMDQNYVHEKWLSIQVVSPDVLEKYRKFVAHIIARNEGDRSVRYLAKNNNNILRVNSLKEAFPDSVIIVPFRNPHDHAKSLHTQHSQFRKVHAEDIFALRYMNWLGHFEFGGNFKPFKVSDEALPRYENEPEDINYWIRYWTCIYYELIQQHSKQVYFFDYDRFCKEPDLTFMKLGKILSIDPAILRAFSPQVKLRKQSQKLLPGLKMPVHTMEVYEGLKKLALQES